jgi:hypothetical protein
MLIYNAEVVHMHEAILRRITSAFCHVVVVGLWAYCCDSIAALSRHVFCFLLLVCVRTVHMGYREILEIVLA